MISVAELFRAFDRALSKPKLYNIAPVPYTQAGKIIPPSRCNGWTVKNTGSTQAFVNNVPIIAGDFISVGGNEGEEYVGRIDLRFANNAAAGNEVWFIPKFYSGGENFDTYGK